VTGTGEPGTDGAIDQGPKLSPLLPGQHARILHRRGGRD